MSVNETFPALAVSRRRALRLICIAIAGFLAGIAAGAERRTESAAPESVVTAVVYPAVPDALARQRQSSQTTRRGETIVLANGYLAVEISAASGVITAVENKLSRERHAVERDRTGVVFTNATGAQTEWFAESAVDGRFAISIEDAAAEGARVRLATRTRSGANVTLSYTLAPDDFWVERRLAVTTGKVTYQTITYGRAELPSGVPRVLKLGKFDAPRLITAGKGGLFAGVGWWFYEVNDGLYQNSGVNHATEGTFEAEPWYVGVFQPEAGEPYPGWFWYKTFLESRKLNHDKQTSYALWNARSGHSFDPINNPELLGFVDMASQIGLRGITAGEVRGLANGTKLAATDAVARKVIDAYAERGVDFGLHEGDVRAENWRTDEALARKLALIDAAYDQGIRNLTVDFFGVEDHFTDHRRVATFFRHIREKMAYSECHLGMAAYGPQFQREVLINHPTDLKGFDIGRFSADWATLLGFRHSRREWQKRYEYLMPENGLYYFCTHYSNYPRRYLDPEPQQFLYNADAWRGLAYAFHDKLGFRDAVAAQAAFSTFYVFGFLDAKIPAADATFARDYLAWVKANASVLNRGRACFESDAALVMSKVRNGRGLIFALNYLPGKKRFDLQLALGGSANLELRQVYPVRTPARSLSAGATLSFEVPGERLAIFEVNGGLAGLPPENPGELSIDVSGWQRDGENITGHAFLPDVRGRLDASRDPSLPQRIVSADQVETEIVTKKPAAKSLGKLPPEFLAAYGFTEEKYLETWQTVPWAFADRVWLVYVPKAPPTLERGRPALRVNGREVQLIPRVAYDPRAKGLPAAKWTAPMWFADITGVGRFGAQNEFVLERTPKGDDPVVFITSAARP